MKHKNIEDIEIAKISSDSMTPFGLAKRLAEIITHGNGYLVRNSSGQVVEGINQIEENLLIVDRHRGKRNVGKNIGQLTLFSHGIYGEKNYWHMHTSNSEYVPELTGLCDDFSTVEKRIRIERI